MRRFLHRLFTVAAALSAAAFVAAAGLGLVGLLAGGPVVLATTAAGGPVRLTPGWLEVGPRAIYLRNYFVLSAPLPLLWLGDRWVAGRRPRFSRRRCQVCGYDLRATPDRCPECGTPAAGTASRATAVAAAAGPNGCETGGRE